MHTKFLRSGLILALIAFAVGCNQQPQTAAPVATPAPPPAAAAPDASVMASVHALRSNNIAAMLDNALPARELAKLKADWSKEMNKLLDARYARRRSRGMTDELMMMVTKAKPMA